MEVRSELPARYGAPHNDPDCIFCSADFVSRAIDREGEVLVVPDLYPVTSGHILIVPVEHYADFFDLPDGLRKIVDKLLFKHRRLILNADATVSGFNIGANCGVSAGQTVMHAHIHLIPRREGDVADSRGGVRGCVPDKRIY